MEKSSKQYNHTRHYHGLTKHAREMVDAISDLPVWQDMISDFDDCPVAVYYEARQGWRGQFPHSLHFASSLSKVPQCMFEVDYSLTPEQCRMMLEWERQWAYDDAWSASEVCTLQYNAKAMLKIALLADSSDLKFRGYLVGSYGRRFEETLTIEPIWQADSVMAYVHARDLDGIGGCEIIEVAARDQRSLCTTLQNYLLDAIAQHQLVEDYFIVIPKRLLPANFIALETKIEHQAIFPHCEKRKRLA